MGLGGGGRVEGKSLEKRRPVVVGAGPICRLKQEKDWLYKFQVAEQRPKSRSEEQILTEYNVKFPSRVTLKQDKPSH